MPTGPGEKRSRRMLLRMGRELLAPSQAMRRFRALGNKDESMKPEKLPTKMIEQVSMVFPAPCEPSKHS